MKKSAKLYKYDGFVRRTGNSLTWLFEERSRYARADHMMFVTSHPAVENGTSLLNGTGLSISDADERKAYCVNFAMERVEAEIDGDRFVSFMRETPKYDYPVSSLKQTVKKLLVQ
jgi:hypothetical protein